jgi:hypothetical protein
MLNLFSPPSTHYIATGVVSVKVIALPLIVAQIVSGSEPTCSVVKPWVFVTVPGTVTGIGCGHVLPVVLSVIPVIVFAVGLIWYVSWGLQASRAMRFAKAMPTSSCLSEIMGQVTLRRE